MSTVISAIDPAAIIRHFELVWGDHDWPENARLAVSTPPSGSARGLRTYWSEMNAAALTKLLIRLNERTDVWIGVAPHPEGLPGHSRGSKKTAIGLPALFADIDTDDGAHKAGTASASHLRMPTRDEAKDIIRAFPAGQLMVVDSGGGFHAWLPLQDILDPNSPDGGKILARWKRWWIDAFHAQGLSIDEGVLADVARVLRPAGTVSWKIKDDHRPVRLVREPGERVSLADLDAQLPEAPAPLATRTRKAASATGRAPTEEPTDDDGPERPGDALAHNVPISAILGGVFGWVCKGETGREAGETARWWTPDGDPAYETHAATYADEGRGETATVFDTAAQEAWGIPEITAAKVDENGIPLAPNQHRWTSWDLLGNLVCNGDWKLAARIAVANPTPEALIETLNAYPSYEEIAEAYQETDEIGAATPFTEAIEKLDGRLVFLDNNTYAVLGGPCHGLQKREKVRKDDGTTTTVTTQITNWVAYRPTVTQRLRITDQFEVESTGSETYEAVVIASNGSRLRFHRRDGFSPKDSTNHRTVVVDMNAGVALPHAPAYRIAADNMLIMLGRDEQREVSSYTSMGWALIDGIPVYLCPHGSVTPDGVTDEYVTGPSEGSEEAGLNSVMRRTGFLGADMPIEEAISAIAQFTKVAPARPELTIAALGLIFSAPLHLKTRAVVVVTGESDSGKTLFSGAVQSFLADVSPRNKDTSLYIPSSSPTAASGIMAWYRDGTCIADDYRRTGDDKLANARMTEVMNAIVQAGYGSSAGAKATQKGGMRGARDQWASALITAEVSADQTAVRNRSISIPLRRSDRITELGGPLDAFLDGVAANGSARSVMSGYIQFLARRAQAVGLRKFVTTMRERSHQAYALLNGARNAETVAALLTGWQTFREFAVEAGVEDQIPSERQVLIALQNIVNDNGSGAADTDPGRIVIGQLSDMLFGNAGHLLDHNNERPLIGGVSPGWMRNTSVSDSPNGGTTERWDAKGVLVGRLSEDQQAVVIGKSAILAAMKAAHLDGLAPAQVYDALAKFCVEGTQPGKRCPVSLGIAGRPDGFVVPTTAIGLTPDDRRPASAPTTSRVDAAVPTDDDDF